MKLIELKDEANNIIKSLEIYPVKARRSTLIKWVEIVEKRYRETSALDRDGKEYNYRLDFGIERIIKSYCFGEPVRFESKAYFQGILQLLPEIDKTIEKFKDDSPTDKTIDIFKNY